MTEPYPVRTAFFGRTDEPLSVAGLEVLIALPGIRLISVTTGRGAATTTEDGALHAAARRAGVPLLDAGEVHRAPAPDLVVSISNPVIFPAGWISAVRWGVVNLHPAPLPEFRGCHGLEHALLTSAPEFGATLHWCDAVSIHGWRLG
jgi:methionyl-tRNA formyltransferase